ncbi:tetratricopeptide repeat protein [Tenacibaculum tangerinum]|uniref:Tetratricopeptide repeat protein n=1 Tax=Tenacibaculum tangerinum TaxID=3038772 RepID=A0ABY8L0D0_9FLAO|nr:tetratricopeptide repeat protein [Tenacibaculum tangerinum]WGH74800.1 tetratricopeptide repeat protein [Tenacibaculum tangerinum]
MKKIIVFCNLLVLSLFCNAQQNEFIIAENYFRNNEYEKAIQLYKKLYEQSPYNSSYLKKLITSYQETEQFESAENLLLQELREKPNLSYLYVILGYNFERQEKLEEANNYYQKALESINKKANYGSLIAGLFKNYSKLDLAIEAFNKTMKINPEANYEFQLAQIYGEKGDFKLMFDSYIDLVDKNEEYLNNVKRYASRYLTDDGENENNILFKKALLRRSVSKPKDIWNNLLSWLFIKQKQYNKALIQNKALFARNSDNLGKINELGEIAFKNKDYETAKECFEIVIENTNYPRDKFNAINNNLRIAIATNQPNIDALFNAIFKEYGINSKTLFTQVEYANYLTFTKNTPEEASVILKDALDFANSKFIKATIKLKLGDVYVYMAKFNKALINYSQVQTAFKNHFLGQEARFKVAQASYFKNDFTWAKAQLKVLKGSATQLIANDAANLFLTISDNEPKDSISSGLKEYAKADLLAFQNKNDEAIAILDAVINEYKGQSIEDEALFKQAQLFVKKKRYDEAILNYAKIIALDEAGIYIDDVYYQMAELYNNELKNTEKAKEYYQKIIFDHPSSIYLVEARKKYRKLRGDDIN